MTKTTMMACAVLLLIGVTTANATPIVSVSEFDTGDADLTGFTFNVDPNGETYDSVDVIFTALDANTFNQIGTLGDIKFAAGVNNDTGFLFDVVSAGASIAGVVDTTNESSAGVAVLAGTFPASALNFADVVISDGGRGGVYSFDFVSAGVRLGAPITGRFLVPEPASSTMAAAFLVAMGLFVRRRKVVA